MKYLCLLFVAVGLGFSQVIDLRVDSILDPGNWTNPGNIITSDDQYGEPSGNQDVLTAGIQNPADTTVGTLDSVKVHLEQHVSDTLVARWYVVPVINGRRGTATPEQPGTATDANLIFNISGDITGWADLINLDIDLHPVKGPGAPPEWFADYLHVIAFVTLGITEEKNVNLENVKIVTPTIARGKLTFTYSLTTASDVSVEIFGVSGVNLLQKNVEGTIGANALTLTEIGRFTPGVYFLKVSAGDHQFGIRKFIVMQ